MNKAKSALNGWNADTKPAPCPWVTPECSRLLSIICRGLLQQATPSGVEATKRLKAQKRLTTMRPYQQIYQCLASEVM